MAQTAVSPRDESSVPLSDSAIPTSFHSHPSYRPTPVPHLVLPDPWSAYCLTPYIEADEVDIHRLAVHPDVVPYLGPSGADDPKYDRIMAWNLNWLKGNEAGSFFQALRETALVQAWNDISARPPLIGTVGIGGLDYGLIPEPSRAAFKESVLSRPPRERYYQNCMIVIDPAVGKRGLYTAAFNHLLDVWYLPTHPPPGHLLSGWDEANLKSARLHERLGFRAMARHPKHQTTVVAVWQGAGEMGKDQSVLKDCPDL